MAARLSACQRRPEGPRRIRYRHVKAPDGREEARARTGGSISPNPRSQPLSPTLAPTLDLIPDPGRGPGPDPGRGPGPDPGLGPDLDPMSQVHKAIDTVTQLLVHASHEMREDARVAHQVTRTHACGPLQTAASLADVSSAISG